MGHWWSLGPSLLLSLCSLLSRNLLYCSLHLSGCRGDYYCFACIVLVVVMLKCDYTPCPVYVKLKNSVGSRCVNSITDMLDRVQV